MTEDAAGSLALAARADALSESTVVVVPRETPPRIVRDLLRAGVRGLVFDVEVERTLTAAVAAVRCGLVVAPRTASPNPGRPALTSREKQVIGLIVLGFTNAEIASKLYIAESTVKTHVSAAFAKLNVSTRSEAAALILDSAHGLGTGILTIVDDAPGESA